MGEPGEKFNGGKRVTTLFNSSWNKWEDVLTSAAASFDVPKKVKDYV